MPAAITYAKFIEKYGDKYGKDCIKETEDEFNAIIASEKARLKLNGKKFDFNYLFFHFKFGEKYEKMQVQAYTKKPNVSASERKANSIVKAKERQANPETSSVNTEDISITRLMEITEDSNLEFEEVGREGHFVDLAGRKKETQEDKWMSIQMKGSKAVIPQFDMDNRYNCPEKFKNTYERFNYYENMIIICYNVLIDEFLIIPPYSKGIKSGLYYDSEIAKKYYVKKEDIIVKIDEYIEKYQELEKPFSDIELLCTKEKQLEIKYIRKRQETLSKEFDMEEINFRADDFIIDKFVKVQEKAKNHINNIENSFQFTLEKKDGKPHQPYSINDNDFYWLNLAGTNYFYVIPSKLMEKDGMIRKTLKLHKEFKTEKENKRWKYTDTWTYGFRFDWTKLLQENIDYEKEVNRLWCLVREINLSETFIIDQLSL
jgi:hypothetical protein